ncbi:MFS transporter, putative metabolite:H+ symporter [Paraburkholderia aspalathi]|uniref:MFS transporter, putative metabolite:H+ symporter n=1 Tax=Paraburkholderia aspalathi TaxID=1324617 RepID=A0A1I7E9C7_9BURK|nr:MFS transporter, putative metabolite:H+ symporter [Paraburkholderia aspalathi]
MTSPDHARSVARSAGGAASSASATASASAASTTLDAGSISARLDRLPATRSIWKLVVLLSLGFFFELYDLLYSGYVAPGLVKSGLLTATTHGLFGSTGVASFIAALFSGLFIGTIACGFLADRFGRRAVFTYSLLWYTAANVVMAFQETATGLNFWRFVACACGIKGVIFERSAFPVGLVGRKTRIFNPSLVLRNQAFRFHSVKFETMLHCTFN